MKELDSLTTQELIQLALDSDPRSYMFWTWAGWVCGRIYDYALDEAKELHRAACERDRDKAREILRNLADMLAVDQ